MNVIPLVQPDDLKLAQEVAEDVWSLDAPWICFVAATPRPHVSGGPSHIDLLVGTAGCPHDERAVTDVLLKMVNGREYRGHVEVDVRRGSVR